MAYWWVSHRRTFRHERDGGFLWAPLEDRGGRVPFHWATMHQVRRGDIIFSYVRGRIAAVSTAISEAYPFDKPAEGNFDAVWQNEGVRVDVAYEDPPQSVEIASILSELQPLLPDRNSPLTSAGQGNQGYLYALPPAAGWYLLQACGTSATNPDSDPVAKAIVRSEPDKTTRTALIESRVGQGQFRKDLFTLWNARCCMTGLDVPELLRASHIKRWADSNNQERVDPYNGLLLSPAYDAAFDAHLISFDDEGRIVFSPEFPPEQAARIGVDANAHIDGLADQHLAYLRDHRKETLESRQAAETPQDA